VKRRLTPRSLFFFVCALLFERERRRERERAFVRVFAFVFVALKSLIRERERERDRLEIRFRRHSSAAGFLGVLLFYQKYFKQLRRKKEE